MGEESTITKIGQCDVCKENEKKVIAFGRCFSREMLVCKLCIIGALFLFDEDEEE